MLSKRNSKRENKEFRKRYDYYLKIKKALKIIKKNLPELPDKDKKELQDELRLNQTVSENKKPNLELGDKGFKYKISVMKENKPRDCDDIQEKTEDEDNAPNSPKKLPNDKLAVVLKSYREKYKKLLALKAKNDHKLK
uniref:Uncharacterized protein n=1 Tax=Euplotes crassus TaxID=5936 RepID=A0A7S3P208_EUPCR|mmetsp:Transcript_495/g.486  ORF Transcript_495/g.486 Transcript_495/m.486 type:complete len:138 (+) Transcript_495:155-568(+)